jgi:hypothetical protein
MKYLASAKLISRLTSLTDIDRYLKLLFDQQIQSLTQVSDGFFSLFKFNCFLIC